MISRFVESIFLCLGLLRTHICLHFSLSLALSQCVLFFLQWFSFENPNTITQYHKIDCVYFPHCAICAVCAIRTYLGHPIAGSKTNIALFYGSPSLPPLSLFRCGSCGRGKFRYCSTIDGDIGLTVLLIIGLRDYGLCVAVWRKISAISGKL